MKQQLSGSNINLVKAHNIQVVLLNLLNEESLSRVQLARRTKLSNTTITNLVSELIDQGIIVEENGSEIPDDIIRPVGRPRTSIRLQPNARYVFGIHIGVGTFRVALTNLRDEIIDTCNQEFDVKMPAEPVLEQMAACVESLIDSNNITREHVIGLGVGASGLVDFPTGVNIVASNLSWRNIPIRDYLQERLHLPVVVDNNVRTMAIGETYFGAGRNSNSLVFVYGRVGVGAGLTFKGDIYRGNTMGAGEIGHTIMLMHGGERCHCGNSGCLETLVSESAILRQSDKIASQNPDGILAQLEVSDDVSAIERVFIAGRQGDENVRQMLEERGEYLGIALVNVVNLFNPEQILLGGIFSQGQDFFLEPAIKAVRQMSFGRMGEKVTIQSTTFGWKAGVVGAAALALINFFYQAENQ